MRRHTFPVISSLLVSSPVLAGTSGTNDDIYGYLLIAGVLGSMWLIGWGMNKLVDLITRKPDEPGDRNMNVPAEASSHAKPHADERNDKIGDKVLSSGIILRYALSKEQA